MPKDTKKKANPALEDDEVLEEEDADTETDEEEVDEAEDTETEDDADEDADEADEEAEDEEEVEEEPAKKPAKASKGGKGAKSKTTKAKAKARVEEDEDEADEEDIDEEVAPKRDPRKAVSRSGIEAEMLSDIEATKRILAKQPKVRIFIPLGIGEKKGSKSAIETVTINGFRTVLPKGEYVTVPQGIADKIEEHYNMAPEDTEMGERYRLDRPRFKEGISTEEALG